MAPTTAVPPRRSALPRNQPAARIHVGPAGPPPTELDARGPTPPKPLAAIVAALEAISPGTPQYVRTSESPAELLHELSTRGVEAYPQQLPDGSWRTLLICGAPARLRAQPLSRRNGAIAQT